MFCCGGFYGAFRVDNGFVVVISIEIQFGRQRKGVSAGQYEWICPCILATSQADAYRAGALLETEWRWGVLKRTHDMFFGGGGVQHEASCAACQALMSLIVLSATRNVIL